MYRFRWLFEVLNDGFCAGLASSDKMGAAFLGFPYSSEQHQHALQQFLGASNFAHAYGNPTLNPIDRLYSMQNSYFCTEEASINDE